MRLTAAYGHSRADFDHPVDFDFVFDFDQDLVIDYELAESTYAKAKVAPSTKSVTLWRGACLRRGGGHVPVKTPVQGLTCQLRD